ncbi:hypothetical protein Esi_0117_0079 [Ectocarpus siliculosus]|uniref:Uncharacterized protein n=1 Tax=Ectocarpus siliculosus TaxID=2880 RepID=D7FI63_ECTSI|nr:hypothetical protein Esi_0117_0079 [Ectocarpus siliculosus]|eukprot:CBJ28689.1 hypothetical protein Esi_0117_0079 [Ectocarpus siliculosus]
MLRSILWLATVSRLPVATFAQDHNQDSQQRLGVIVPAYDGDLARAVSSLERWPVKCSPLTLKNADLVLYYAEEASSATASALDSISSTAGRCFSRTRVVYANLAEEDDIYPKGPSVMFYKMFLDENVRSSLSEYDALSIVEWDVLVASDNSFEELYHAAFRVNEEFWVKGSNLEGTSFHSSAEASEMWQVLGHINGNAIYNNDDPAFVEYVEYTRARWGYEHPYDVALWMTISDFPYSWPLYQRYSSKFVVTNLISYVGYEHVSHDTVSDAVAGKTLFIHGSSVEDGNVASYEAVASTATATVDVAKQTRGRKLTGSTPKWKTQEKWRSSKDDSIPKWKRNQKWQTSKDDKVPKWKTNQKWKNKLSDGACSSTCEYTSRDGTRGRVCDANCSTPDVYGTRGCNAKQGTYGEECRACFNDVDKARKQDTPENRSIMCSTKRPVEGYGRRLTADDESDPLRVARDLETLQEDASSPSGEEEHRQLSGSTPKWKSQEKWRTSKDDSIPKWKRNQKWQTNKDDKVPKWKNNQKWKNKLSDGACSSSCEYTSRDGTRGRVCDANCSTPDVYGTRGCNAKQGTYGEECRACFNDVDKARKQDTPENRSIICSNKRPVEGYGRRLTADDESDPLRVAHSLETLQEDASSPSGEEEHRQLSGSTPKWKSQEKWRTSKDDSIPKWKRNQKWQTSKDDKVPKWKTNQKWKNKLSDGACSSSCEYTSRDGTRGRVCDANCSTPDVYGTRGCNAKQGTYGEECRACFNDVDKARKQDTPENRSIMCSNKRPVEGYGRRLTANDESDPLRVARSLETLQEDASSPLEEEEHRQLSGSTPKWKSQEKWRTSKDDSIPKWKRNQKWQTSKDDKVPKWKTNQKWKNKFSDGACSSSCEYTSRDGTRGRVCDANCSTPDVYGTRGCNAKQGTYGEECRACFNDVDKARKQDTPENRSIMCSTKRPVEGYGRRLTADDESDPLRVGRSLETLQEDASSPSGEEEHRQLSGSTPKWKSQEKWRTSKDDSIPKWKRNQKWQTSKDDKVPKWKTNQKWKNKLSDGACSSTCEYTSRDGTRGRVCDANCSTPDVYGTRGCNAKQGTYGEECRACFNDVDKARKQDTPENRSIMCSTVMPVDVYGRRLTPDDGSRPLRVAKIFSVEDSEEEADDVEEELANVDVDREDVISFFEEAAERPYSQDLKRRNLCAFVGGRAGEEAMWDVTVKSILQFVPGMRVAIAAEAEGLDAYERSMGGLPGVTVSGTQNPATAALFADQYCGPGTALILYVEPGSVLSRPFTSKDTHSPRGDLLVVHTGSQGSYHDAQLRRRSASVLGFDAPSFTHGTDLMLPVGANEDLRESLGLRHGASLQHDGDWASMVALQELVEFDQFSAVPQVLAALAYSRDTPGVWFLDPQAWVGQHLFQEASIWNIPLVKPRYTCAIAPAQLEPGSPKTAEVLQSNLDFFSMGGKCANGLIDFVLPLE